MSESLVPEAPQTPAAANLPVVVNGEARSVVSGRTLQGLVEELGLDRRRVAVAVNRDIIPHSALGERQLVAGDHVEILEAVGGG